jgi:hypothetical protein
MLDDRFLCCTLLNRGRIVDIDGRGYERKPGIRSGSFCIIDSHVPTAGLDYPRDLDELEHMFPDELASRRFVEQLRYPRGFVCGHCGAKGQPWRSGTGLLACVTCREPSHVTHGTLFDCSPVSLKRWLRTLWAAAASEGGLNAASVQSSLGLQSASGAGGVLDSIRHMMASCSQSMLTGDVQVAISRLDLPGGSAQAHGRPVVAFALGSEGGGKHRVRLRALGAASSREVVRFVIDHVGEGHRVLTSPWRGFRAIGGAGYQHVTTGTPSTVVDGGLDRLSSLLRLWLWSCPEASLSDLQGCLHDFAFRYNRREYPKGLLFYRLMILAVTMDQRELSRLSDVG